MDDSDLLLGEFDDIDDELEEFVFEPDAWDFAIEIGMTLDLEPDAAVLEDLSDAMLVWATGPELERLTDGAVEGIWDHELEALVREGIERVGTRDGWEAAAAAALVEFDRDPRASEVGREIVRYLASQVGGGGYGFVLCLDCLSCGIAAAPRPSRRGLAVRAAIVAARAAAVPDVELRAAVAEAAFRAPAARLATIARRKAVRDRLGYLGRLGARSMPALATELKAIAGEPLPDRAEDDDVWQVACTYLVEREARPLMH
ncbi:MAG: hypothetical protein ACJ77E_16545 [Gaiellaceae bacterium]